VELYAASQIRTVPLRIIEKEYAQVMFVGGVIVEVILIVMTVIAANWL